MKITHVVGSPRKNSNSRQIADHFISKAEEKGALVTSYDLNKMDYRGCQGCYGCKKGKDRCVLKDDLSEVLNKIYETDILVISTPVYFWDLPGQLKLFIDRSYSFAKDDWQSNPEPSRLPKGKKLVFIQTQGAGDEMHDDIYQKYDAIFKIFSGFKDTYLIKGSEISGVNNTKIRPELMEKAESLVNEMLKE